MGNINYKQNSERMAAKGGADTSLPSDVKELDR